KLYKKLDETEEAFRERCLEMLQQNNEHELKTLEESLQRQQDRLREKMGREVREAGADQLEAQASGVSVTSGNQEQMELHGSIATIDDINKQLAVLEIDRQTKL